MSYTDDAMFAMAARSQYLADTIVATQARSDLSRCAARGQNSMSIGEAGADLIDRLGDYLEERAERKKLYFEELEKKLIYFITNASSQDIEKVIIKQYESCLWFSKQDIEAPKNYPFQTYDPKIKEDRLQFLCENAPKVYRKVVEYLGGLSMEYLKKQYPEFSQKDASSNVGTADLQFKKI